MLIKTYSQVLKIIGFRIKKTKNKQTNKERNKKQNKKYIFQSTQIYRLQNKIGKGKQK
jgi:hypothetical protein